MSKMINFFNPPKQTNDKHYDDVRTTIANWFAQTDDVISIYEYGTVSAPGVSDLDVILVLRDTVAEAEYKFEFTNVSADAQALVEDGNVIKMPKHVFEKIHFFENGINLKLLAGAPIVQAQPDRSQQSYLDLVSILDWVPERMLRLTKAINSKQVNITMLLCVLHSLKYSIIRIDKLLASDPCETSLSSSEQLFENIKSLRLEWYDVYNPTKVLQDCIEGAISLSYERLQSFEEMLKKNSFFCREPFELPGPIELELHSGHFVKFVDTTDVNLLHRSSLDSATESKVVVSISDYFFPHFNFLAQKNGTLSEVMRKKMSPPYAIPEENLNIGYRESLETKLGLAEDNAQFLRSNGLEKGLFRYGFHFQY